MSEVKYNYEIADKILEFIARDLEKSGDRAVEISKIHIGLKSISPQVISEHIEIMNAGQLPCIGKLRDGDRVWLKDKGKERIRLLQGGDPFLR